MPITVCGPWTIPHIAKKVHCYDLPTPVSTMYLIL